MRQSKIRSLQIAENAIIFWAILSAALIWCAQSHATSPIVNADAQGLALNGFDPVAYFETGSAEPGNAGISATHDGATYHFATEARRDKFLKEPDLYLPSYGGFCAYGVAVGHKFNGDPEVFTLSGGRLFLQLDRATQILWKADLGKNIAIADRTWPVIRSIPAAALND